MPAKGFDLIVVGAGPAGVLAAWAAARAGLRVALLDHKPVERIGDKVCGDALITKFLARALPPDVAACVMPREGEREDAIRRVHLEFPSGKTLVLPIDGLTLVTVDRLRYGQRLLADALHDGVQLYDRQAVSSALIEDGRVAGVQTTPRGNRPAESFRAPLVVDASGATGVVRRSLPPGFAPYIARDMARPGEVGVTFREILRTPEPHGLQGSLVVLYPRALPPPGYLWYFARGDRLVNAGIGYRDVTVPGHASARELYRRCLQEDARLGPAEALDSRGATLPTRRPLDTAVAPGLMLAGDAAFHADALTGEGHGTALLAGYWAGETAIEAHRAGDFSERRLWAYNRRCMAHFGQTFAARFAWARALESFSSRDFDFIHALVDEDQLADVFQKHEFVDSAAILPGVLLGELWRAWQARCVPSPGFLPRFAGLMIRAGRIRRHYRHYPAQPSGLRTWLRQTERLMAAAQEVP